MAVMRLDSHQAGNQQDTYQAHCTLGLLCRLSGHTKHHADGDTYPEGGLASEVVLFPD